MSEVIERIIYYILGGTSGVAGSLAILPLISHHPFFDPEHITVTFVVSALIGVIMVTLILEYQTEKNLKINNIARNENLALIVHEMRTGLTSTSWAIQLILENYESKIDDKDKKMLQEIVGSIRSTIINSVNLLNTSLMDIGKLSISLTWVDLKTLKEVFTEIVEKYAFGIKNKGINLTHDINLDSDKQAEVDITRLRIILENLLENSLQYRKDSTGIEKKIVVNINNDKTNLNMTVSDNGIGIPKEEQGKIFLEFYRASNARQKLSNGSGIGLYMCQQYVKAHKGSIRFESKENEGTTFYITIPLKTSEDINEFLNKI